MVPTILIIEDELLAAEALAECLKSWGYGVSGGSEDSVSAVLLGSALKPDIAIVDLHLRNGPTGLEVVSRFAAAGIPSIVISGGRKAEEALAAKAVAYLEKPYRDHDLRRALDRALAVAQGRLD